MNDFNWRNQPLKIKFDQPRHVVKNPLPIVFNGQMLPGSVVKPEYRIVSFTKATKNDKL